MQESIQAAMSVVRSRAENLGIDPKFYEGQDIHIHVPEGAPPKDGPSAGITMATALLSLALATPIKRNLAMTGELTLTGKVLAVGGGKEKIIAARRASINEIILPADNKRDYDEIPLYLKEGLTVHFANEFKDVSVLCP